MSDSDVPTPEPKKKADYRPPGCIWKPTVVAFACLGTGIYLISRPDSGGGMGKTAAVAMIFFGALLSIPFLLITFGFGVQWFFHRKMNAALKDVLDPARKVVADNKVYFAEQHDYRDAVETDFAGLDVDWYQQSTAQLEAAGFRRLGDVVNATIERQANVRPVLRRMVSADGTTTAALFHLVLPNKPDKSFRTIDLETEYTDGTFCLTSNTADTDLTTSPPALHRNRQPAATPLADLLASHEAEKQKLLAAKPGVSCVVVTTAEDSMAAQRRQQVIKNAFRKGIGFVDPEEVRRIAEKKAPDDQALQALAAASADIARREDLRKGDRT